MRVASGGIRTHDTLHSGQMLYQLSYQGSSAGRVRTKHLICLYEQANLTQVHVHELIIESIIDMDGWMGWINVIDGMDKCD